MKTNEQRIAVLHQRAGQLRRRQEKAILSGLASLSLLISVLLIRLAVVSAGHFGGITGDTFAGASLLDENIGGYVLAAVLAFMAGVSITVAVVRYRNRNKIRTSAENSCQDRDMGIKTGQDSGQK